HVRSTRIRGGSFRRFGRLVTACEHRREAERGDGQIGSHEVSPGSGENQTLRFAGKHRVRLSRRLTKAYRSELEQTVGAHRRTRIICIFSCAIRKCRRTGVTTNSLAPQANCPGRRWHGACEQGFDGWAHGLSRPSASSADFFRGGSRRCFTTPSYFF